MGIVQAQLKIGNTLNLKDKTHILVQGLPSSEFQLELNGITLNMQLSKSGNYEILEDVFVDSITYPLSSKEGTSLIVTYVE